MGTSKKLAVGEELCFACNGTGVAKVRQQAKPGRRVYPPKCAKCGGRGRILKRPAKRGVAEARSYL
jgi:DnaJ-class molecular chaperone